MPQYLYGSNNGKPKYLTYGTGKVIEYKYDELDRIQEICYNDHNGIAQSYKYVYTADGIRTNKIVNGTNHIYTWCWKVIINMIREQWEEIFEYEFS